VQTCKEKDSFIEFIRTRDLEYRSPMRKFLTIETTDIDA